MNLIVSHDIKLALKNYLEKDLYPGSYLMAIINNDLRGAIGHAHELELPYILDAIFYVDLMMRKK